MDVRRERAYAGLDALLASRERELHQDNPAAYVARRVEEEAEPRPGHVGIAPELRDLISGNTRAEIEMSIQRMVTKTSEILAGLRAAGLVEEEPPAAPEPFGQRQGGPEQEAAQAGIFTSAEEAAAAAGPWSTEFQAWRRQHIPSSRGLI
jgi:hypothetical protein